ncbi:Kinesin-like protein NACK1 [Platanthera guangdongensis]|uniref:Kinesin-like protein NACK1 n=1 Tax=Platanthera guangdongensis TaxID=2320717 RepID=A0ABR2M295_9ASPA
MPSSPHSTQTLLSFLPTPLPLTSPSAAAHPVRSASELTEKSVVFKDRSLEISLSLPDNRANLYAISEHARKSFRLVSGENLTLWNANTSSMILDVNLYVTPALHGCEVAKRDGSRRVGLGEFWTFTSSPDRHQRSTPGSMIDKTPVSTPGGSRGRKERILVTVRLRPLSKKEHSLKDLVAWECTDDHTIVLKPYSQDRSSSAQYTFDKVFGPTCPSEVVYEEGAKKVSLSALTGINATIFAYGQTSSGKTYTMRKITQNAVNDIYKHIENTRDREFIIKISALEIYNEVVKDLLRPNFGPLRLLDDPEKGTIVEKLEEETVRNSEHLRQLIGICEAQRHVGETSLNDASSRSHQIIRLTIESNLRENSGCIKSYVANLDKVAGDNNRPLDGREKLDDPWAGEKSQMRKELWPVALKGKLQLAIGKGKLQLAVWKGKLRLKAWKELRLADVRGLGMARHDQERWSEQRDRSGQNRILNSLSILYLYFDIIYFIAFSDGKRAGHVPYRQSKLTRILQLSLGGNARTAIICTMSPALSHVEQSRITLSFASCAKEVMNAAQVNMVVSDKQLVKQLQKEVARLEAELRTPEPSATSSSEAIILEKEIKIKKMEMEIQELKRERDAVKSQLEELRRKMEHDQSGKHPLESSPRRVVKCLTFSGQSRNPLRQSSTVPSMLVHEIRKLEQLQVQLGEEANRALEVLQKEVACHKLGNQDAAVTIAKLQAEIKEVRSVKSLTTKIDIRDVSNQRVGANLKEEITRLHSQGNTIANLEERLENVQKSLDRLVMSLPSINFNSEAASKSIKTTSKRRKMLPLSSSGGNVNRPQFIRTPCSPLSSSRKVLESDIENQVPENDLASNDNFSGSEMATPSKSEDGGDFSSKEGTPGYQRSSSVNMKKMQKMFQNAAEENVRSIKAYVTELKERVAKLQYQKQLLVCQVLELEANEAAGYTSEADENAADFLKSPNSWHFIFQEQMQLIIQLWQLCHVSIIHRTQFYLLFRGDPADQIYVEVELRRLTWLQQHFSSIGNASPAHAGDDSSVSPSSR